MELVIGEKAERDLRGIEVCVGSYKSSVAYTVEWLADDRSLESLSVRHQMSVSDLMCLIGKELLMSWVTGLC